MRVNIYSILLLTIPTIGMYLSMSSCTPTSSRHASRFKCVVDSVSYHGVGEDNTLQLDPYWELFNKEYNLMVKSAIKREVGDTIVVDSVFIK